MPLASIIKNQNVKKEKNDDLVILCDLKVSIKILGIVLLQCEPSKKGYAEMCVLTFKPHKMTHFYGKKRLLKRQSPSRPLKRYMKLEQVCVLTYHLC